MKVEGTITYSGEVDTLTLGNYKITYEAIYNDESISKTITISVIPFYSNDTYKISVLDNFNVTKADENVYSVSGTIVNNSGKSYRKIAVTYYCKNNDTAYTFNFDNGMGVGEQIFTVTLNSTDPLNTYQFNIINIVYY